MNPFFSNGITSDHVYQSMGIDEQQIDSPSRTVPPEARRHLPINVATWNLQDFCFSADYKRPFSNNPFDYTENPAEYKIRKEQQIDKIMTYLLMEDIIFLQEADFLFHSYKTYPADSELHVIQQQLAAKFLQGLTDHNFEVIMSPQNFVRGYASQKLVTLFNRNKLKLHSSDSVLLTEMGGYSMYRGLEAVLMDTVTNDRVIATNMHLKYGESPVRAIQDYQAMHKDHLCILGGDTNHVDEAMLELALGKYTYATNFSRDKQGHLTTIHENSESTHRREKSYDRFFATPSPGAKINCEMNTNRSGRVRIIDGRHPMIDLVEQAAVDASEDFNFSVVASFLSTDMPSERVHSFSEPSLVPRSMSALAGDTSARFYSPQLERASSRLRNTPPPMSSSQSPFYADSYPFGCFYGYAPPSAPPSAPPFGYWPGPAFYSMPMAPHQPKRSPEVDRAKQKRQVLAFVRSEPAPPSAASASVTELTEEFPTNNYCV